MKILKNQDLYMYNTMRLHSIASVLYIPESIVELKNLIIQLKKESKHFYILSAGSNIIFSEIIKTPIISMMSVDNTLQLRDDGAVVCGASVRIQNLINWLKDRNLGGIEYLFSVPSSVGGAIYMNAGRGRKFNKSISDYVLSVSYLDLDNMQILNMDNVQTKCSYRKSPFQDMNAIVLNATFSFKNQNADFTKRLIKERLDYSKTFLSADKPSCGSVFCKQNPVIMRLLKGTTIGGAMFSKKTSNWISNKGDATASDIENLVRKAEALHHLFFLKCKREIRFYK